MTEISLQFNLANPVIASVIAGASSVEQIRSNAKAVKSAPLSKEEVQMIQSLTKADSYQEHRQT